MQLVQEMLMHNVKREQSKVTAKKVIEMISTQYGVSVTDMKSKKRQKKIVETRQIAMYLLKNNDELDLSLTAIGGLFGGKDHSTVISSIRKIDKKTKEDVVFKKEIEALNKKIFRAQRIVENVERMLKILWERIIIFEKLSTVEKVFYIINFHKKKINKIIKFCLMK